MIPRQSFEIGSLWPNWASLKEGFAPWEFEVNGEDPDLVFHYGCEKANCTFNIRVDTKPAEKLKCTTQVNTEHNHALTSLSQGAREEAKKSIRRLKKEFREEALKEMELIREAGRIARETTLAVRTKQDQVLEDYLLAIGKRKMEKFREEAAEAGILVNRGSRRSRYRKEESSLLKPASSSSPVQQSPSPSTGTMGAKPSTESAKVKPSSVSTHPTNSNVSTSQRESQILLNTPVERQTQSKGHVQQQEPPSPIASSNPPSGAPHSVTSLSDSSTIASLFLDARSWPNLLTLRQHLSSAGLDYSQTYPTPSLQNASISPPQLSFRCNKAGCPSRFVVDLQQSGAYTLQSARSYLQHSHSEAASSTTLSSQSRNSNSSAVRDTLVTPGASRKRTAEPPVTPIPSKRPALPTPAESRRKIPRGFAEDSDDDDVIFVEPSVKTEVDVKPIRASASVLHVTSTPSSSTNQHHRTFSASSQHNRSIVSDARRPSPRASADSPSSLLIFLRNLDSTGAYDFSCYHSAVFAGGIETPQQLRLFVKSERRLEILMKDIEEQDEGDWRGKLESDGGRGVLRPASSKKKYATYRREMFRDLLASLNE